MKTAKEYCKQMTDDLNRMAWAAKHHKDAMKYVRRRKEFQRIIDEDDQDIYKLTTLEKFLRDFSAEQIAEDL